MTKSNNLAQRFSSQKILSIALPCILGWTFAYLATNVFRDYAFGLFIWLPLVLGPEFAIDKIPPLSCFKSVNSSLNE